MEKDFVTNDLWLSSYLSYRGIIPTLENRNNRIVFLFPQSDTLYKLLNAFNSGDPVPLSEYIDIYKALKVRMFQARG
jgi:hypothetical protein